MGKLSRRMLEEGKGVLVMKVDEYPMELNELPEAWKPTPIPFSYEHKMSCRYCEMRKHLKGAIR
jgi:hypothetical protein